MYRSPLDKATLKNLLWQIVSAAKILSLKIAQKEKPFYKFAPAVIILHNPTLQTPCFFYETSVANFLF